MTENDISEDQKEGTVSIKCPWSVWKGYGGWFCKETEEKCIFSTPCFFKCDIYKK